MGDNGHDNPTPAPIDRGGQGEALTHDGFGKRERSTLQMLQQAVHHGWKLDPKWLEHLPKELVRIAVSGNERSRLRAIEILRSMQRDQIDAAALLHRLERLERGESTENVSQRVVRLEFDDRE